MPQRREPLPSRRHSETFKMPWGGLAMPHTVTVGYYDDGRVGEVFIAGGKSGEAVEAIARDGAVLLSMALQHGVPMEVIAHAITRDGRDQPQTIVGAIVDMLAGEQRDGRRSEDQASKAGSGRAGVAGVEGSGGAAQGLAVDGAASSIVAGEADRS